MGHRLAIEQSADQHGGLVEPLEPLAEPRCRSQGRTHRARARTSRRRDRGRAAGGQVIDASSRAWRSAPGSGTCWRRPAGPSRTRRSGQRVRRASPSPRAWGRSGRPRRRAGGRRSTERIPAGALGGQAGVTQLRPAGPIDPERRAEPHRVLLGHRCRDSRIVRLWPTSPSFRPRCGTRSWPGTRPGDAPCHFARLTDPWAILVSEVMAQQTQAARAGEAWIRFMTRFPTVEAVADAPPAESCGHGMGSATTAGRWACSARRGGSLSRTAAGCLGPGGAAVAARRWALHGPGGRGAGIRAAGRCRRHERPAGPRPDRCRACRAERWRPRSSRTIADEVVARDRPGAWTHAVMDIGATLCRPRRPECADCPAWPWCRYAIERLTDARSSPQEPRPPPQALAAMGTGRPRKRRRRPSRRRRAGCVGGSSIASAGRRRWLDEDRGTDRRA